MRQIIKRIKELAKQMSEQKNNSNSDQNLIGWQKQSLKTFGNRYAKGASINLQLIRHDYIDALQKIEIKELSPVRGKEIAEALPEMIAYRAALDRLKETRSCIDELKATAAKPLNPMNEQSFRDLEVATHELGLQKKYERALYASIMPLYQAARSAVGQELTRVRIQVCDQIQAEHRATVEFFLAEAEQLLDSLVVAGARLEVALNGFGADAGSSFVPPMPEAITFDTVPSTEAPKNTFIHWTPQQVASIESSRANLSETPDAKPVEYTPGSTYSTWTKQEPEKASQGEGEQETAETAQQEAAAATT